MVESSREANENDAGIHRQSNGLAFDESEDSLLLHLPTPTPISSPRCRILLATTKVLRWEEKPSERKGVGRRATTETTVRRAEEENERKAANRGMNGSEEGNEGGFFAVQEVVEVDRTVADTV